MFMRLLGAVYFGLIPSTLAGKTMGAEMAAADFRDFFRASRRDILFIVSNGFSNSSYPIIKKGQSQFARTFLEGGEFPICIQ